MLNKLLIVLCFLLMSCDKVIMDDAVSAMEGKDKTGVVKVEGCGSQYVVGYAYCRIREGEPTSRMLWLTGPKPKCSRDSCVHFKIFDQTGAPVYGNLIPKDRPAARVPWSVLVQSDTFSMADAGEWGVLFEVYWDDNDGREQISVTEAAISLRILLAAYIPLHEVPEDAHYTWKTEVDGQEAKFTTGLRTYVSPK